MRILKSIHRTNNNNVFTIIIYDRESVSDPEIEFKCSDDFFKIKQEGAPDDPYKRIVPSSLSFTVLYGSPEYTTTQENAVQDFYNALTNSYEGRFYVTVTKAASSFAFMGKILPDVGDYLLDRYGDFVVTAIDGITDLQDIEYRPDTYTDLTAEAAIQTATFADHFRNILEKIDTVDFFKNVLNDANINYPLYSTANNWTEVNSVAGDIWQQVKVRNYWYEQVSPTYRKYKSCWDALTDLLTGFNARVVYDGMYHFEQLGYMDNLPTNITTRQYLIQPGGLLIDGSPLTKVQHNYDSDNNLLAAPNITQRRLPAFKAVVLEQSKSFFNYINGMIIGSDNAGPHYFGWIIATGNKLISQLFLNITGTPWTDITYQSTMTIVHTLVVEISIGDYYLVADDPLYNNTLNLTIDNKYFIAQGGTVPTLNWSLVPSPITIKISKTFVNQGIDTYKAWIDAIRNTALIIQSNEIQAEGKLRIKINSFVSTRNNTVISSFPAVGVTIANKSRVIIGGSYEDLYEQPAEIKRYEIGDIRNSTIYNIKCGYYDASESKTLLGQLFMAVDGNPNFDQLPTTLWTDPDGGIARPIQDLMLRQMLSMRAKPSNTLKISLFYKNTSMISPRDQIVFDGDVYIPIQMETIASGPGAYTTFNAILWKVTKDYDGINVVPIPEPEIEPTEFPVPDGSVDLYNVGGVANGLQYWEEWSNISTPYVEPVDGDNYSVLVNLSDEYTVTIKKKWQLYINGVKQLYTPTGTLALRQWRFDLDNNRIIFVKGSGNVGHVEVFKYY